MMMMRRRTIVRLPRKKTPWKKALSRREEARRDRVLRPSIVWRRSNRLPATWHRERKRRKHPQSVLAGERHPSRWISPS